MQKDAESFLPQLRKNLNATIANFEEDFKRCCDRLPAHANLLHIYFNQMKERAQRMIHSFNDKKPKFPPSVFIAPSAEVIGDVEIGAESSVWFGSVIRGDVHYIRIGERTSIQDLSVLHVTRKTHPLIIGSEVTVGHRVTLHGCTIHDRVLGGRGSKHQNNTKNKKKSFVGAGALVTEGMK